MIQKFIVTIDSEDKISSWEVAEALNCGSGCFSLNENHGYLVVATARKFTEKKKH